MVDFNELKFERVRREFKYNGEIITILNPIEEEKNKMIEILQDKFKLSGGIDFDFYSFDDIEISRYIYETLVQGIDFPKDNKEFEQILTSPNLLLKQIKFELDSLIRDIGLEYFLELKKQIWGITDTVLVNELGDILNEFQKTEKGQELMKLSQEELKLKKDKGDK